MVNKNLDLSQFSAIAASIIKNCEWKEGDTIYRFENLTDRLYEEKITSIIVHYQSDFVEKVNTLNGVRLVTQSHCEIRFLVDNDSKFYSKEVFEKLYSHTKEGAVELAKQRFIEHLEQRKFELRNNA